MYVYKNIDEYKLAYKVDLKMIDTELHSQTIFIDANDGSIIRQSENINNLVQPKIANAKGVFGDDKEIQVAYKQGEVNFADGNYFIDNTRGKNSIKTVDLKGQYYFQYDLINSMEKDIKYYTQNLEQSDGKFVDAHYYVGKAYDFYHDTLNRDGIDTNGSKPVVLANVNNPGNAFYIQDKGIDVLAFGNGETGIPDGVSIAPVASTKNMPIALVSPRDGAKVFDEYINDNNIKASYIIGKQSAISNEITNKLPNAKRLGGNDRDETNAIIIKEFYNDNNLNNIFVTKDGMDKEDNLIDALSIGVLASKEASPVVIVGKNLNEKQEEVLSSKRPKILTQVGGNGNEDAFERIKQLYN